MTTKQTIITILIATVFQFVTEAAWFLGFAKPIVNVELGCIMRPSPYIPLNFVSELALSVLIVLAVRLYPKPISPGRGLLIGLCIGALVSLNQQIDWFANWIISPFLLFLEITKNSLLGVGVGLIAAFTSRKKLVRSQQAVHYSAA